LKFFLKKNLKFKTFKKMKFVFEKNNVKKIKKIKIQMKK